ncbi:MAG: YggS family pyridoxal phosphate-dependent enzyme [Anaerolineae bacterium]|nr:YggS family pyridoxal phosphate-dependent enzyme [Anaerolineae bacterium]
MSIADNIKRVQDRIDDACAKANRDPFEIILVAVSKQKSVDDIVSAVEAGIQHIGENRVEEGAGKIAPVQARLQDPLTWHMVGHVQSRKAKQVIQHFDMVQSVDSLRLAKRFSRLAGESDRRLAALLEINVSGEASKQGFAGYNWYQEASVKERLWNELGELLQLPHLDIHGLMTMAPFNAEAGTIRRVFADLVALRDELQHSLGVSLPELSMGMTDDFELAIAEGSTMIRVGRAIFGDRN